MEDCYEKIINIEGIIPKGRINKMVTIEGTEFFRLFALTDAHF
jgi:hypothetical protein